MITAMPLIWGKHVSEPSTAEEISRSVGVTRKDAREVRRLLAKLGYLKETRGVGKSAKGKGETKATPPAREAQPTRASEVVSAKGTAGKVARRKATAGRSARPRGGTKPTKRPPRK